MSNAAHSMIGSRNHAAQEREKDDYYATDPTAIDFLFNKLEHLNSSPSSFIWECAAGEKHLSNRMSQAFDKEVKSTDLIVRTQGVEELDFLSVTPSPEYEKYHIITNPPFKHAEPFIRKGLDVVQNGNLVCMFLKTVFLEGQKRRKLFDELPPKYVMPFSKRISVAKNADFDRSNGLMSFSWFVWEKGTTDTPQIHWL